MGGLCFCSINCVHGIVLGISACSKQCRVRGHGFSVLLRMPKYYIAAHNLCVSLS